MGGKVMVVADGRSTMVPRPGKLMCSPLNLLAIAIGRPSLSAVLTTRHLAIR